LSAATEDEAILRIEAHEFDFARERGAGGAHDFLQHARVEEKSRAEVEAESLGLDRGSAAADEWQALDDAHAQPRRSEQNGRGQTTGACTDDDDATLA
jgi:hypothetical protein